MNPANFGSSFTGNSSQSPQNPYCYGTHLKIIHTIFNQFELTILTFGILKVDHILVAIRRHFLLVSKDLIIRMADTVQRADIHTVILRMVISTQLIM